MKRILTFVRKHAPNRVRVAIKRMGSFFDPLPPEQRFPSTLATLASLRAKGFNPSLVVDVGAYIGEWTVMVKDIFPASGVLMVEPQDAKRSQLEAICQAFKPSVKLAPVLLGAEEGAEVDFLEMETGSSVFEERSHFNRRRTVKRMSRLDSILSGEKVDLLKLDVQGYELEVLKGAPETLPLCDFVLLEASLVPINQGAPLFHDVIAFMHYNGFLLYDICSTNIRRADGVLWQTDLLFVNKLSNFLPKPELT